jgi:lysyl-tRNA synthetase class 1
VSTAFEAKSWPFEQARALLKRVEGKSVVTFQTGFGPSGAPHVGTFGEVVRTNMVRRAFEELTEGKVKTRLLVFSDDYDGFRRVPDGLPSSMEKDLGRPLSWVDDPFGEFESFAERNNSALRAFLDGLGIDYEFVSATDAYRHVIFEECDFFQDTLMLIYDNYDAVMNIMLPTLGGQGSNRAETYSPFMPVSDINGHVLDDAEVRLEGNYMISYRDVDGERRETNIFHGFVKLQWKVDWAMRWMAFDVDYEMHGKDLIDSATLSTRICKAVGRTPPLTYFYELFLDDEGRKVSKSKGNGMAMEEWLAYSDVGPLAYFMFQSPRSAKAFTLTVVPRVTDEYLKALGDYSKLEGAKRFDSPVWHIHAGSPPTFSADVSYSLLINLATVSSAQDAETLMNYLRQYKALSEDDRAVIESLVPKVIAYVREQTEPKVRRQPSEMEAKAFRSLISQLETMEDGLDGEAYQFWVYEVGKSYPFDTLRDWFRAIYEVLFGDEQGPRFGTFIAAYGRERSIDLLKSAL